MNKKNLLLLSLFTILSVSCSSSNNQNAYVISCDARIRISDIEGNDLLNPNIKNSKSIDLDKIRIFYVVDGKEVEFYEPNYSAPRAFSRIGPYGDDQEYKLQVFLNLSSTKKAKYNIVDTTNTVIYWNENEKDVITSYVDKRVEGVEQVIKVLFKDNIVWPSSNKEDLRGFRIIK